MIRLVRLISDDFLFVAESSAGLLVLIRARAVADGAYAIAAARWALGLRVLRVVRSARTPAADVGACGARSLCEHSNVLAFVLKTIVLTESLVRLELRQGLMRLVIAGVLGGGAGVDVVLDSGGSMGVVGLSGLAMVVDLIVVLLVISVTVMIVMLTCCMICTKFLLSS